LSNGTRLLPSAVLPCRAAPPAICMIVGYISDPMTGSWQTLPGLTWPGHLTISGTRIPPSYK
jgi:hypothetical protein